MTRQEIKDWRQRIIEAEERYTGTQRQGSLYPQGFTEQDKRDANGWQGCAVGELFGKASKAVKLIIDSSILRNENKEDYYNGFWSGPRDRVLKRLGNEFSHRVETNDFLRAYEIIDLIEARVLELRSRAQH